MDNRWLVNRTLESIVFSSIFYFSTIAYIMIRHTRKKRRELKLFSPLIVCKFYRCTLYFLCLIAACAAAKRAIGTR